MSASLRALPLILLALAGLAACSSPKPATPEPAQQVAAADKAKRVCTRERPTGSNREVLVCRDYLQAEKEAAETRRNIQNAPRGGMPVTN